MADMEILRTTTTCGSSTLHIHSENLWLDVGLANRKDDVMSFASGHSNSNCGIEELFCTKIRVCWHWPLPAFLPNFMIDKLETPVYVEKYEAVATMASSKSSGSKANQC